MSASRATVHMHPVVATTVAACLFFCPGTATAKQISRLWYFGGSLGFHSTQDSVSSNAALTDDPRPDRFQNREMSVEDGLSYSVTAGYGMTRLLSVQLDVGYFKGDVGDVDVFLTDTFPVAGIPGNPTNVNGFRSRETTIPVTAGQLTEIPVTLSAVLRFRPAATVNPWVSVGFGKVFTEVTHDPDIPRLNDRMSDLRIRSVADELGNILTPDGNPDQFAEGRVPMEHAVSIDVEDAKEWHLAVGLDYFINDRLSVTADIRYSSIDQDVVIDLEGEDEIVFSTFTEKLFRKDGSLKFFSSLGRLPNPMRDPRLPEAGRVTCFKNTRGDFNRDGRNDDLCFEYSDFNEPYGTFVVQGGEINLSGLAFKIGLRFHF